MNHALLRIRVLLRPSTMGPALLASAGVALLCFYARPLRGDDPESPMIRASADRFQQEVKPVLEKYCFDCHGDGKKSGQVALDAFKTDAAMLKDRPLVSVRPTPFLTGMV